MLVYLVLTNSDYGGSSDTRKVFTNLSDALAQKKWLFDYVEKNSPLSFDDFDAVVMKVDTESGKTSYIDDNDTIGNEFTTKLLGF